jgi:hypothetical protein
MKNNNYTYLKFSTLILTIAILACSNPADSDNDHDEHHEPVGFVLKMNGTDHVKQENGTVTGSFTLTNGNESDHVNIYYIAEDGDEFQPHTDEGYSLAAEFANSDMMEFESEGDWGFHLHPKAVGTTTMTLKLMHGGHSDFTSQNITITVN